MEIIRKNEVKEEDRGGYYIKRLLTKKLGKFPEDLGFYHTAIPKGSKCKEQWHEKSYEAVYFLTKGSAKLNGKMYSLEAGDLVVLDPNEKHEWLATENDVSVFALRFPNLIHDKFTTEH